MKSLLGESTHLHILQPRNSEAKTRDAVEADGGDLKHGIMAACQGGCEIDDSGVAQTLLDCKITQRIEPDYA